MARVRRGKLEGVLKTGLQRIGAHDQVGLAGARGRHQCIGQVERGPAVVDAAPREEKVRRSKAWRTGQAHCAVEADPALGAIL